MKVKKLIDFLLKNYPLETAEVWDPSGFSVKFNQQEKLRGVVSAIDLTNEVLDFAIHHDANVILTHHPFKFEALWKTEEVKAPYKMAIREKLKQHRIFVFAMHTNYDNHQFGTSYQIARKLGLEQDRAAYERPYPCLIETKDITINEVISRLKNNLGLNNFRTNLDSNKFDQNINKIAILSGSGYISEINYLTTLGYELIITSDIKWSDWIVYKEINAPILEVPHLDEQVFAPNIKEVIEEQFPEITVHNLTLECPYKNI